MQLIDRRTLVIGREIGKGSFGVVRLGNLPIKKNKYKKCAIKELNENGGNSKELMDEIVRMSDFKHTNILEIYGYSFEEEMFSKRKKLIMIMEYCEKGSLDKRLKKDPKLSPKKMLKFSIQIANGMCYLASKDFVHRDLAARNILLINDEQTVKIGDFGLSRFLNGEQYYSAKEKKECPISWMPPEVLKGLKEFEKPKRFSTKSDVWGFGVTMWEMFSHGKIPWEGRGLEVMDLVLNKKILEMPEDCPLQIWEVIQWCWTYDYRNRPNFEILKFELDQIEEEFETTIVSVMNSGSGLNLKSIDPSKSNYVEMSPINITQKTEKLNTYQNTPCHSSPINLEVDEKVESESEGFDASSINIRQQDLEGNNLLDKDINNDSKSQNTSFHSIPNIPEHDPNVENDRNNDPERLLKQNMAIYDKDPKYRCLCGIHVRNDSIVWSMISLLFNIVYYLFFYWIYDKQLFDDRRKRSDFIFEIGVVFLTCFCALTTVFIPCAEKCKFPHLYLPYLFTSAVLLLLFGVPIQEYFFTDLIFGVTNILVYSISVYLWFVALRAYQYLCILKEVERRLNALPNP